MFITAVFVTAKLWNQPRCPPTKECIKEMWHRYAMEYYSATKKNEAVSFAGKWMELDTIMLSEISHTKKHKYHVSSLICRI
jgi:hypothetical protein